MFNGVLADLAALAAINISDPKGDGSVSLSPGFFLKVESPGNNSPPAWFFLRNEPTVTTTIQNWATIAAGRAANEVWINDGPIIATDNTPPSFSPPPQYAGLEWRSKYTDIPNSLEWIEKWFWTGAAWSYSPSVIEALVPPSINPAGRGSFYYEAQTIYVANYDLSGWSLLTTTGGIS